MLEPETVTFLESGCALIVGTVSGTGEPHATRGWGLSVLSAPDGLVRLLLDADDATTHANLAGGGAIAVTATDVRTLRSSQLKGLASAVEEATDEDRARAARFADDFFTDIVESDGTPREHPERLRPSGFVGCTVTIAELFDQTPGPGAGARIGSEST